MPKPDHMYLPPIDGADSNLSEPALSGHWYANDHKIMRGISDGILIDEQARGRGVSSIPDVWARPLLFRSALRRGLKHPHPLRDRFVQEWRGLMSLLALHRLQANYELTIVPVPLGDGVFQQALSRLAPQPIALEKSGPPYEWTDVLLIKYGRIPLGAFSPATLVYTATDYQRALRDTGLNLQDENGFLRPPNASEPEEMHHVGEWLEKLQQRLKGSVDSPVLYAEASGREKRDVEAVSLINGLIEDWRNDLRKALGILPADEMDSPNVEVDPDPVAVTPPPAFLKSYRIYQELLRPLRREGDGGVPSDFLLSSTRSLQDSPNVLVITPALLETGGRAWGNTTIKHLGNDSAAAMAKYFNEPTGCGTAIGKEDLRDGHAMWVRPERYFLEDRLVVSRARGPLLAQELQAMNGEPAFLLPFKKTILDFFSPQDIQRVLAPSYRQTDTGITFRFQLPVGSRTEAVEKTYSFKASGPAEPTVVPIDLPAIEIFPKYLDANWRRYYVFHSDADNFTVRPCLVGDNAVADRIQRPIGATGQASVRAVVINGDTAFPEALEVLSGSQQSRSLGLILVPPMTEPHGLAGQWRVGIDFGTSNTNIFRRRDDNDAERWEFSFGNLLWAVTGDQHAARSLLLEGFFVPPRTVQLPLPTALRIFQDAQKEHPLLDYFIYFSPENGSDHRLPVNVNTNIKWDTDQERRTGYYFESLLLLVLMQAAAERIQRIQLLCSYPKAFSDDALAQFKGAWNSVMTKLLDSPGRVLNRHENAGDKGKLEIVGPDFEVEGIAAGEFFASEKAISDPRQRAKKAQVAVSLDVGGGTTDISVWYRNDIVADASVLLAGRQISGLLQQNPRMLETLFTTDAAAALQEVKNDAPAFAARLNMVLARQETQIRDNLLQHGNRPEVQWIRRMLAVQFGATAYYAATLVGAADRSHNGGLVSEIQKYGVSLHWGGNAAKFVNWIDFGQYAKDGKESIAARLLNSIVGISLKELGTVWPANPQLQQLQSPGHKSEVAGGLVVMDLDLIGPHVDQSSGLDLSLPDEGSALAERGPGIICGENIELTTGSVGFLDTLSKRRLFTNDRTTFKETSMDRLSHFVSIINHVGKSRGLLTQDGEIVLDRYRGDIAAGVARYFIDAQRLPEGRRVIEPVFIMEVRLLLDLLKTELHQ